MIALDEHQKLDVRSGKRCARLRIRQSTAGCIWPTLGSCGDRNTRRMNLVERLHKTGLYDRRRSLVKLAEAKLEPVQRHRQLPGPAGDARPLPGRELSVRPALRAAEPRPAQLPTRALPVRADGPLQRARLGRGPSQRPHRARRQSASATTARQSGARAQIGARTHPNVRPTNVRRTPDGTRRLVDRWFSPPSGTRRERGASWRGRAPVTQRMRP